MTTLGQADYLTSFPIAAASIVPSKCGIPSGIEHAFGDSEPYGKLRLETSRGGGTPLCSQSLLGSGERAPDSRDCSQVLATIGITSTPVIDVAGDPTGRFMSCMPH